MIVYNVRRNGPYEYDKFALNIFQLYNLVRKEKQNLAGHQICGQLEELDKQLKKKTLPSGKDNALLDRLLLLKLARGNKWNTDKKNLIHNN